MRAYILSLFFLLIAASTAAEEAVDAKQQRITISLPAEPPNLNSLVTTDQYSNFVLSHVMEGLLQYDQRGQLAAGVAERWELRADGATFWLRRDARWSDGKPVTAQDFVFAWRTAVAPATGSQYATALFPIKNAERINRGELPLEQLGVRASDAYKIDVQFERPCPYFLGLTAFFTYYPVREDFYRLHAGRYGADAEDLLFNGAFKLTRWVHGAALTLERNPHYWNHRQINLQRIDIAYITSDSGALLNLYKNGNIALLTPLEPEALQQALTLGYPIKHFSTGSVYFWEFNFRPGRLTANKTFRQALQALFDPELMVNKIVGIPGLRAAESIFPRTLKVDGQAFIDRYPPPIPRRSLALARSLFKQAQQELGLKQIPPLIVLTGDSPRSQRESEYFQQLLTAGLGLQVRLDRQTFKQRIEKMTRGDFDIVLAGWGADYDDPLTYGDLMASWNENNRGRYSSAEYDHWVSVAQQTPDAQQRLQAFAAMQQLLHDDVPVLMSYENAELYLQHPQLQGVTRNIFGGDPNYRYARVIPLSEQAK